MAVDPRVHAALAQFRGLLEWEEPHPPPFDSAAFARQALEMIACADRMRSVAAEVAANDPDSAVELLVGALVLERSLPLHGLVSLGIASDEFQHPSEQKWLLQMHLNGLNDGAVGEQWLGISLRALPWVDRHHEKEQVDGPPFEAEKLRAWLLAKVAQSR